MIREMRLRVPGVISGWLLYSARSPGEVCLARLAERDCQHRKRATNCRAVGNPFSRMQMTLEKGRRVRSGFGAGGCVEPH
jgi:hypothetical protein